MHTTLDDAYRLIAELLIHPDERDAATIAGIVERHGASAETLTVNPVSQLVPYVTNPAVLSADEYVQTLELSPPCPLYLGDYLFDEPSTCRDVGTSERNAYMITLRNLYLHFGFEPNGRELPDFLPLMVEFAQLSRNSDARDGMSLRRFFIERYLTPGLPLLRDRLLKYESVYAHIISALMDAAKLDVGMMGDVAAWAPPPCADDGMDHAEQERKFSCPAGYSSQCASRTGGTGGHLPCQEVTS